MTLLNKFGKQATFIAFGLLVACSGGDEKIPDRVEPKPEPESPADVEPIPHNFLLGTLVGFEGDIRRGNVGDDANNTRYNMPLYSSTEEVSAEQRELEWWDNLAEELAYSGVDYAMMNCRGVLPGPGKYTDHGDPKRLTNLIDAMERRGLADKFKIAIFDDCPASWAAARNLDLYGEYTPLLENGVYDYPLDNLDGEGGIYKYIWDYNIKLAFQTVPEKYQLKYKERPLIFLWSVNNFLNPGDSSSYYGKVSPILTRLRQDFIDEFGVDPFIVVDRAFQDRDSSVGSGSVVDGINNWFIMADPYTVRSHKGVTIGVGVPGFSLNDKQGNPMFIDANHGKQLSTAIKTMAQRGSNIILIEGFTDVYENAALWRSTDTKFYDYPNQRLNILRRFSANPYPANLKVEAEGCDFYEDTTTGNSGGAFRKGDLDVAKCADTYGGWCVADTAKGEWLEWKELPLSAGTTTFELRYASTGTAKACFGVGEKAVKATELPSTGGEWKTIDAGSITLDDKGFYPVTLEILSGDIDINYFNLIADGE